MIFDLKIAGNCGYENVTSVCNDKNPLVWIVLYYQFIYVIILEVNYLTAIHYVHFYYTTYESNMSLVFGAFSVEVTLRTVPGKMRRLRY